jgi:hypothetical protein
MSQLVNLQNAIITRLTQSDAIVPSLVPANGQVSWITENIGDLASNIAKAIGKIGIVGIVMTPGGGKEFKVGIYPPAFRASIEIQLQENVTINRGASGTQIASLDLVEFIIKRLHLWSPGGGLRSDRIELQEVPYKLVAETPLLVYNVNLTAPITLGK